MNNSLIFKGLQNNDEETIRKVKSAFIAELELSVDKVTQIFDNPPTVIIEGVEDEKLERFKKVLEEAGAVIELKGDKPASCLAHWLEDEDFKEEDTLNSDSATIEFDDSPLELEGSLFKDDEETGQTEDKIEYEASGLCFEDESQAETITEEQSSGLSLEDEASNEETDLTIDFADDNETLSVKEETLSLETESSEEQVVATEDVPQEKEPEPDLSLTIEEVKEEVKEEPVISVAEETVQEVKEATPIQAAKTEEPPTQAVAQETQVIEIPELHYKKSTKSKMPWDVIIIATIGVILLGIANWFYFRG